MKQFYFLFIVLSFSVLSFAQTEGASKIYGYKQKVMPGTVRVDESGREIPRQPRYNYFIYLASTTKVTPVEIWINGEAYAVTIREVSSPVEYSNPTSVDGKPKTLVPKTSNKVLQLTPSSDKIQKPAAKNKTVPTKNEIVAVYKGNNKLYYKAISKLNEMEPVAMQ